MEMFYLNSFLCITVYNLKSVSRIFFVLQKVAGVKLLYNVKRLQGQLYIIKVKYLIRIILLYSDNLKLVKTRHVSFFFFS